MKLQNKLLRAFSLNIILLILIGLINTIFVVNSQTLLKKLSSEIFTSEKYIDSLWLNIHTIHGDILSLILEEEKIEQDDSIDETAIGFYNNLESLKELYPGDRGQFDSIESEFREFYLYGKWLLDLPDLETLKSHPDAVEKFLNQKNDLFTHIKNTVEIYGVIHLQTFEKVEKQASWSITVSIFIILFGVVLSFAMSLILSKSIARPVLKLTQFVNELENGRFNVTHSIHSNDEIGHLADGFTKMSGKLNKSFSELRNEIEERQKIEKELIGNREILQYLKSLLQSILNSVKSIVIAIDGDGLITHWNHSAEIFSGIKAEQAINENIFTVMPYNILDKNELKDIIKSNCQKNLVKEKRIIDDEVYYFNMSFYPHKNIELKGLVISIEDITDTINIEEVMIQSEKMLSIGGLAAGMAHEINNPLAGMIQTASVMGNRLYNKLDNPANIKEAEKSGIKIDALKEFMESRGIPKMINSINESGKRAADIVENMLSFARKEDDRKSTHTLIEIMDKSLELARTDYDLKKEYDFRKINIRTEYAENLPPILCVSSKLQQVILNILRNGAQAMLEARTESPQFIIKIKFLRMRKMLSIEIKDNGPGMDEKIRKRIFEPFFTTKEKGAGTGLGLSVSYFIITDTHQGELIVQSTINQGTNFIINLPIDS